MHPGYFSHREREYSHPESSNISFFGDVEYAAPFQAKELLLEMSNKGGEGPGGDYQQLGD